VLPSQSFHSVRTDSEGYVSDIRPVRDTDFRINGGFFSLRTEIFKYLRAGEELVEEPFRRLIANDA
jgi:glucose-1-phosphate cytidylyltransferase